MTTHKLKLLDKYFDDVLNNNKTFECSYNDRNYQIGDILELHEITQNKTLTGRTHTVKITYILSKFQGLQDGYVILSIKPIKKDKSKNNITRPKMRQTKINTANFILELMDNLNDIRRDDIIKDKKIIPSDSWDTARFIEFRMDEFDETPLLTRIIYLGSEFHQSTQGFSFELLGTNKILKFKTFVKRPKSIHDFEQFLSQCLDELANISDTESCLDDVILTAFHRKNMSLSDLETLLEIKTNL